MMRGTMWRQSQAANYADWQQRRGAIPDIVHKQIEDWADTYAVATGHVIPVLWRDYIRSDIIDELRPFFAHPGGEPE